MTSPRDRRVSERIGAIAESATLKVDAKDDTEQSAYLIATSEVSVTVSVDRPEGLDWGPVVNLGEDVARGSAASKRAMAPTWSSGAARALRPCCSETGWSTRW